MLVARAELDPVSTAGLSKTKPTGKAPVLVLKANPERAVKMVANCHPPMKALTKLLAPEPIARPRGAQRDFPHVDHAVSFDSRTFRLAIAAATLPANDPTTTVKDTQ